MAKSKLSLPPVPTYYEDPNFAKGMDKLYGLGNRLTSFDFTGDLSGLAPTINIDPNVTSSYFDSLQPYLDKLRKQTIGQLAANNQLESSVTADRLGQIDTDVANLLQGKVSDQLTQAMQNRISLFGTGLNTINSFTGFGQANQTQRNSFNLDAYDRQVEAAIATMSPQKGGLSGAITGALGGALSGFALGDPWGAAAGGIAGGLAGGLSTSPGLGGSLMTSGASLYGNRVANPTPTGLAPYAPGSSASNSPFRLDAASLGLNNPFFGASLN